MVLTIKSKNVVKDPDNKKYIDVLISKFPTEIRQSEALQPYGSLSDISEKEYKKGDRDSLVYLHQ